MNKMNTKPRQMGWALVVVMGCLGFGQLHGADWPQYNGTDDTRTTTENIGQTKWTSAGPKVVWKVPTDTGFSSLTIANGKAFTLVGKKAGKIAEEMCMAIDIKTGKTIWTESLDEVKYDGGGNSGGGGDGPRSTPTYDNGKVYVLDARLNLYCFDANRGRRLWKRDIVKEHKGRLISWQSAASPLIEGNLIYVAGGGAGQSLLAFDKRTGKTVWKTEDVKMTHATPIATTIHGVRQIVFFTQAGLISVVPQTGKVLWRQKFPYRTSSAASPVVYEDIVYCSAGYGVGAGAYRITKNGNTFSVAKIWRKPNKLINHWSTPVCKNGYLYGMFSFKKYGKGPLQCVDIRTGEIKWSEKGFGPGNCIVAGNHVVALSDKGELVLITPTPNRYTEIARADLLDGKCWSTPTFSDGQMYIRSTTEGARVDLSK